MVGVLGMLAGAAAYVALFPILQPVIKGLGDAGEITLPGVTGTSPWPWVVGMAVIGTLALWLLRRGPHLIAPKPSDPTQPITSRGKHDYSAAK